MVTSQEAKALDTWNYETGQTIRVVCYTNSPQARLELNGKVVGETKAKDPRNGIVYWDIPYEAGTLKAVGVKDGKEEAKVHLSSPLLQGCTVTYEVK